MQAIDLQEYLRSLDGGWINQDQTVDTFKSGDPQAEVQGIAVGWMSYTWALKKAVESGCNVFVTHEPTYYNHFDNDAQVFDLPGVNEKRQFIEENGLVILRCHDLWDRFPQVGIPDSWAELLELGPAVDGKGYFRVYEVNGHTAVSLAKWVAKRTMGFGQEAVELIGPADRPVKRVSIGTGAIVRYLDMISEYEVDLAIATDDGINQWRDGAYAIDMGVPLIVVNHAVSEEAGLMNLARHLQQKFPAIPVQHIPQRCMYRLVGSE
jgi:putative NIF3 family GTP cyclohydrolase 1 type 2